MSEPGFSRELPADDDVDPSTMPTASRTAGFADWARREVDDPNATSVNDALGAAPDRRFATAAPGPVRAAVTFGPAAGDEPSPP